MSDVEATSGDEQGLVAEAPGPFSAFPGGPPNVTLSHAGETGYPGVRLQANQDGTFPRQNIYVVLPEGSGLRFANQLLTVHGNQPYSGSLSPDQRTLTFKNVDLALKEKGSTSVAWVEVKASANATLGETALTFCVGDQGSRSTPVRVVDHIPFSVTPGGPPPVQLQRGGTNPGYPGVKLSVKEGTVSPQRVYVALPQGKGLRFATDAVNVLASPASAPVPYHGTFSDDEQTLVVEKVDLALSGEASAPVVFVAVLAPKDAQPGDANLLFCVGDRTSASTLVQVVDKHIG
ncbi:hypothetical protein ACIQ9Q_24825 [Streptomyces sp. NPDC094438]|uniref:hypothetical protein n=1 Tax=Streptomyces sp. NPDC094438 TaxID=3366061 RepID=UPI00382B9022